MCRCRPNARPERRGAEAVGMQTGRVIPRPFQAAWTTSESFHPIRDLVLLCEVGVIFRLAGGRLTISRIHGNDHAGRFSRMREAGPVAKPKGEEQHEHYKHTQRYFLHLHMRRYLSGPTLLLSGAPAKVQPSPRNTRLRVHCRSQVIPRHYHAKGNLLSVSIRLFCSAVRHATMAKFPSTAHSNCRPDAAIRSLI